jgi:hypothetical protein
MLMPTSHLYGQPDDEYEVFLPFAETKLKTRHNSGYKLHVTVSVEHHERLARVILATLRILHTHHKVVLPGFYERFNNGDSAGKFITVYAGPTGPAWRIISTIDPVLSGLRAGGVQPGPMPRNRQANYAEPEQIVGTSGMITWLRLDNLRRG